MINDDMPEIFRRMDTMMAQMMREMESGTFMNLPGGMQGYHIVIHGGNMPPDNGEPHGIRSRDASEPSCEVHEMGSEVKVIVELPGITDDALRLDVRGDTLVIDAGDADRHYHTTAKIPAVDPASLQRSFKNGVLEVTFAVPAAVTEKSVDQD